MALSSLFVLCPQLGQDLLVAGLAAGNAVKVAAGGLADRHALGGKGSADVAEIAFVLRGSIFLGNQSSHVNQSLQQFGKCLLIRSQVGSKLVPS